MADGIYIALSGALAQQEALDVTGANLANTSTTGYERERIVFREALKRAQNGSSGSVVSSSVDRSPGAMRNTGRLLDAALADGDYLAVRTEAGERYTRAVSLEVAPDGKLVTREKHAVVDDSGRPIVLNREGPEPRLAATGEVLQGDVSVARMKIVRFDDRTALRHEGKSVLLPTGAAKPTLSTSPISVGALSESNTSAVSGMTELMGATRSFEAFQRTIDAFREIDRAIVNKGLSPNP